VSAQGESWVAWAKVLLCPWFLPGRVGAAHKGRAISFAFALLILLTLLPISTRAEDKKDDKKIPPTITCVTPFALTPGITKSLKIRGQSLADTSAVKLTDAAGTAIPATIKSKNKSEPPKPYEAPRAGDGEVQLDITLPADTKPGDLSLTLTTPAGQTKPFTLTVTNPQNVIQEKEPNNGFKAAQELPLGKTVLGVIQDERDVDVFRIGGRAGMKIIAEVSADRRGSLLDGSLTLYDSAGHILMTTDDSETSRDPILHATIPSDGVYYLSLTDANDHGSPVHAYTLVVREDK
jgi:hypothetical protein